MLNVVIPMAGAGSRFAVAGFDDPKPLIPVLGVPMVQLVASNLELASEAQRFIFVVQKTHSERFDLVNKLEEWQPGSAVLEIDGLTDGAASTVLCASGLIDTDEPLVIANSDQYVDASFSAFIEDMSDRNLDGSMMTMTSEDPKWSYARIDDRDLVVEIAEKVVISNHATVGIYSFARGSDFVRGARAMIDRQERSKGEYYVAPVYNQLISQGSRVGVFDIGADGAGMYGLGTPEDLAVFLQSPVAQRAVEKANANH